MKEGFGGVAAFSVEESTEERDGERVFDRLAGGGLNRLRKLDFQGAGGRVPDLGDADFRGAGLSVPAAES